MTDKKISELPAASSVAATDISVLVSNGTNYQYDFDQLSQFISTNLSVGSVFTFGSSIPQNISGKNGDVFFNTDKSAFYQKINDVWAFCYAIASPDTSNGQLRYGIGIPNNATGNDSDSYIDTSTGIFYLKTSGSWSHVFSMTTGPQGPAGAAGTNGVDGLNGNTILHGTTNPSNTADGSNGDYYLNLSTYFFFGPKAAGVWPAGFSLTGSNGEGLPTGGTAGQFLVKTDNSDFNTQWLTLDLSMFALNPDSVITGLAMSISGSNVNISAGTWRLNNTVYATTTTTALVIDSQDATLSRYDTVYADNAGTLHIISGTLSATPTEPAIPDDTVEVGTVLITPTSVTTTPATITNYVKTTNVNQTIQGIKTFSKSPVVPNATTAAQAAAFGQLSTKVDKVTGLGLSSNDYTTAEKTKLANLAEHYAGYYASLSALQTAHPTGTDGQYATVDSGTGSNALQYIWDDNDNAWTLSSSAGSVTTVNSQTGAVTLSTDNIGEGTTNKYFTLARVLSGVLTGIGFSSASAISATDSILTALGKLQTQISSLFRIPAGGTTGQVLAKTDNTDGNTHWIDMGGGTIIDDTIVSSTEVWSSKKVNNIVNDVPVFVLDGLTNIACAYGINQLKTGFRKALRLRRSTDNLERDFYFDSSGHLIVEDIINFLATNIGYVSKWYDQSGNGNDAVQATAALQPIIWLTGRNIAVRFPYDGSNLTGYALGYTLASSVDVQNTTVFSSYSAYLNAGSLGAGSYPTKRFLLSNANAQFDLCMNAGGALVNSLELTTNSAVKVSNLFTCCARNYYLVRSSSTNIRIDSNYATATLTSTASSAQNQFQIGNSYVPGNPFTGDIFSFIQFSAAQSDVTLNNLISTSEQQYALVNPANSAYSICFEGDSITAGVQGGLNHGFTNQLNALDKQSIYNFAIGGSTWAILTARASSTDSVIRSGKTNVLFVWCGTNDISGNRTATQVYNDTVSYVTARRAAGWNKIYVYTCLPRGTSVNSVITGLNTMLLTDTTHFDGVIDAASDSRFAILTSTYPESTNTVTDSNRTYISGTDSIHPTPAGYSVIASYVDPVIESIVSLSSTSAATLLNRLAYIEKQYKTLSGQVIMAGTAKQALSLATSLPAYIQELYGDTNTNGTIKIAGMNKSTAQPLLESVTLIEPSGSGWFAIGASTRMKNKFVLKTGSSPGYATQDAILAIMDGTGINKAGIFITDVDTTSYTGTNGFLFYDRSNGGQFLLGSNTVLTLTAPNGYIKVIDQLITYGGITVPMGATLNIFGTLSLSADGGNYITTSASTPSTHKIKILINDFGYVYLLVSNV